MAAWPLRVLVVDDNRDSADSVGFIAEELGNSVHVTYGSPYSTNGSSMTADQRTLRVLVVDDDTDHATSLAIMLGEYGYDSHVCLQAMDCMEAVERLRPHVILLDLAMPGMTGFDIAQEIQENPDLRPARLVAVTGHGQDSDR